MFDSVVPAEPNKPGCTHSSGTTALAGGTGWPTVRCDECGRLLQLRDWKWRVVAEYGDPVPQENGR